jgi:broad-specificity NMP kinase
MQLTVVVGAPGAGKTTLLSHLGARTDLLVADMDQILEGGALLGVRIASERAVDHWPAYNRLWVRIIAMLTRAGPPVVLSAPLTPSEWDRAVHEVGLVVATSFVLLDCEDSVRSHRLEARGWSDHQISDAIADATELRELGLHSLDTTEQSVADVGAALRSLVVRDRGRYSV